MAKPSSLRNLGKVSDELLADIGIHTAEQIQELGAVAVYLRLKRAYPDFTTLNVLWALEGALTDTDWRHLPEERKEALRRQVEEA